ncbi:hypothetical protein BG004_000611 [Podila humilis]|nr:hypothetical protein BG004_000611 [Podila humilis]
MKILSISLSLAVIASIVAHAKPEQDTIDPLAAIGSQNLYAWGDDVTNDSAADQKTPERFAIAASELRFRADLLEQYEQYQNHIMTFAAAEGTCADDDIDEINNNINDMIRPLVENVKSALSGFKSPFGVGPLDGILSYLVGILNDINNYYVPSSAAAAESTTTTPTPAPTPTTTGGGGGNIPFAALQFAARTTRTILNTISGVPGIQDLVTPITLLLEGINKAAAAAGPCLPATAGEAGEKTNAKMVMTMIDSTYCSHLADIYRIAVAEAAKTSPALLNLSENISADMRRLAAGSLAILDLMSKHSIASSNDALLANRPIFAADLLNQFREELLQIEKSGNGDYNNNVFEGKKYAEIDLAIAVASSNALEACLRIAADPVAAIDDLNEELESAAAREEEEESGDEEDKDKDNENGEEDEEIDMDD